MTRSANIFLNSAAILLVPMVFVLGSCPSTPGVMAMIVLALAFILWRLVHWWSRKARLLAIAFFPLVLIYLVFNNDLPPPLAWLTMDRPFDVPSTWGNNWRLWWCAMIVSNTMVKSVLLAALTSISIKIHDHIKRRSED